MAYRIDLTSHEFAQQYQTLPPLPQIVTRIQQAVQDEDFNVQEITKLVSSDAALTAQILKVINSAYYGLKREIGDLRIAIAFLGINEIYRIVLSLSVISSFQLKNKEQLKNFWYHSYFTARNSKLLAARFANYLDREELWVPSLLHDIGTLVYLKFYPEYYSEILSYSEQNGCLDEESEAQLKLPPSGHFGSLLARYWRLPESVKVACESHTLSALQNLLPSDSKSDFKKMIAIGSLCSSFSMLKLKKETHTKIKDAIIKALDIDDKEFLLLMAEIRDVQMEVEQFAGSIMS